MDDIKPSHPELQAQILKARAHMPLDDWIKLVAAIELALIASFIQGEEAKVHGQGQHKAPTNDQ